MKYRKITIDLNLGDRFKHLEIDNEIELKEYYEIKNRIDNATNYYLKTLSKNTSMSIEAVEMFNLLEGNK